MILIRSSTVLLFLSATLVAAPPTAPAPTPGSSAGPVDFLRLASEEALKLDPVDRVNELIALASVQGDARDLDGLRDIVRQLEQAADANIKSGSPMKPPRGVRGLYEVVVLPGAFAKAGDMETYRNYLARFPPGLDPHIVAPVYADARDYAAMYKATDTLAPAARVTFFQTLARRVAPFDSATAHDLLHKAAALLPEKPSGLPGQPPWVRSELALPYADIGDADAALACADQVTGEYTPHIYEVVADVFDNALDRAAARRAREKFIAAVAKAPPETRYTNIYYQFTRQVEIGDIRGATDTQKQIRVYAESLPKDPNSNLKESYFACAADAASRLGDERGAEECLKAALASFDLAADLVENLRKQLLEEMVWTRAPYLAARGKLAQALADIAAISDANRRTIALRHLIIAANIARDPETAMAALDKVEDGAERLSQIPVIAGLLVENCVLPARKADATSRPPGNTRDLVQWVKALPTPTERAATARHIAVWMLRFQKSAASQPAK